MSRTYTEALSHLENTLDSGINKLTGNLAEITRNLALITTVMKDRSYALTRS